MQSEKRETWLPSKQWKGHQVWSLIPFVDNKYEKRKFSHCTLYSAVESSFSYAPWSSWVQCVRHLGIFLWRHRNHIRVKSQSHRSKLSHQAMISDNAQGFESLSHFSNLSELKVFAIYITGEISFSLEMTVCYVLFFSHSLPQHAQRAESHTFSRCRFGRVISHHNKLSCMKLRLHSMTRNWNGYQ